jgi:hypothetical protein
MNIIQQAPPKEPTRKEVTRRRSYDALFDTLRQTPETWLSLDPQDISGDNISRKQTILYLSAKGRGMKIKTTYQGGRIYVRTVATVNGEVTHA